MKNFFLLLFVISATISCSPAIHKAQDFDNRTFSHRIVAILPADVNISLRTNELKNTSVEQFQQAEEKASLNLQNKLYEWFLKRSERFKYTVAFQDIRKTNTLLIQNGFSSRELRYKHKDQLAKLLGVDAVITLKAIYKKPTRDISAVDFNTWSSNLLYNNEMNASISINEATQGDLVWKYDYYTKGTVARNKEDLINTMMNKASKKFPYNDK
ncbi:MAG: hypothetical protein ABJA37_02010 [Ferruginibacter sp.]